MDRRLRVDRRRSNSAPATSVRRTAPGPPAMIGRSRSSDDADAGSRGQGQPKMLSSRSSSAVAPRLLVISAVHGLVELQPCRFPNRSVKIRRSGPSRARYRSAAAPHRCAKCSSRMSRKNSSGMEWSDLLASALLICCSRGTCASAASRNKTLRVAMSAFGKRLCPRA